MLINGKKEIDVFRRVAVSSQGTATDKQANRRSPLRRDCDEAEKCLNVLMLKC